MFTVDTVIDTVQAGKQTWVNMFVHNDAVKKAMIDFIKSQADYTKQASKAATEAVTTIVTETTKVAQDAGKFDYTKFGEDIMRIYTKNTFKK